MNGAPLYRPTPSVSLLRGGNPVIDGPVSNGLRGGEMRGVILGADYKPGADKLRYAAGGNPWLVSSGSMNGFLARGLGDDSFDLSPFDPGTPDFYSGAFATPDVPTPDFYEGASIVPFIAPTSTLDTGIQAPDLGIPTFGPSAPIVGSGSPLWSPAPPPVVSSAGNKPPSVAAASVAGGSSIFSSIASILSKSSTPTPATMKTAVVPQSGLYSVAPAGTSFLTQSSIVPGVQNSTVLIGAAVLLAVAVAMGSSRK
jgi:hypothetical protein